MYFQPSGYLGFHSRAGPITEESSKEPSNDYERSKWEQEKVAWEAWEEDGFPVTFVRPSPTIGPANSYGMAVEQLNRYNEQDKQTRQQETQRLGQVADTSQTEKPLSTPKTREALKTLRLLVWRIAAREATPESEPESQ